MNDNRIVVSIDSDALFVYSRVHLLLLREAPFLDSNEAMKKPLKIQLQYNSDINLQTFQVYKS